jgi:hypothetical protein
MPSLVFEDLQLEADTWTTAELLDLLHRSSAGECWRTPPH